MKLGLGYIIKLDNTGVVQPFSNAAFSGLPAGDIALADVLPYNNGANQSVVVNRLLGLGNHKIFDFRLTTQTGVAVSTSDRTSQGTIYLTPASNGINGTTITTAGSALLSLYDGTRWKLYASGEINLSLSLTSGNNYDVFVYDNSGTLTLETLIWTNDTTRATALDLQDGVLCKHGALTRRYVGTIRASGSNVTEDSAANRWVFSYYNRTTKQTQSTDGTLLSTGSATFVQVGSVAISVLNPLADYFIRYEGSTGLQNTSANTADVLSIGSSTSTEATGATGAWSYQGSASSVITPGTATLVEASIGLVTRYLIYKASLGGTAYARGDGTNASTVLRAMVQC